ncbi:MAG: hypothetical protein DMF51_11430 [Acidobacteria bacterium]|nr:MAG: hypothetical protein DMF51_11430 [Acidobacteriota bacterium]
MGLGRITRFAKTPVGARRVNAMRAGRVGVKALAPPDDLFADFSREKSEAKRAGASAEAAHAAAFDRTRYRERFREHIRSSGDSREALRALVEESKTRDVYLMCMCPAFCQSRVRRCPPGGASPRSGRAESRRAVCGR